MIIVFILLIKHREFARELGGSLFSFFARQRPLAGGIMSCWYQLVYKQVIVPPADVPKCRASYRQLIGATLAVRVISDGKDSQN